MAWIVVHDWRRFQHYKDRTPLWIKTYTELMHDDAWLSLTGHRRAILLCIWLEYAMTRQQLTDNTTSLSRRFALKVTTRDLESLNHAGYITISASKPLADGYQPASPEVEKRRIETPLPPLNGKRETRDSRKRCAAAEAWVKNVGYQLVDIPNDLEHELTERRQLDRDTVDRLIELARTEAAKHAGAEVAS